MKKQTTTKNTNFENKIDKDNYNISLAILLNHYNTTLSLSDYKNSVIDYALQIGINIPKNIPEFEFRGIGAVCKILSDGQYLSLDHMELVNKRINELSKMVRQKDESEIPQAKEKQQPVSNMTPFFMWVEDSIDDIILGKKKDINDIQSKYASYSYNKTDGVRAVKFINRYLKNLEKDCEDFDELKESYPHTTKQTLKKLCTTLTEFKNSITKLEAPKKPKKDKPVLVQVSKVPYKKIDEELSLKGLHPKDVIGKTVAYIYDTETRDLIVLNSIAGKFKASGASYVNLDESKCFKKKLRKPKEQLDELLTTLDANKKTYLDYFDSIKTTQQKAVGRMSENKIIIKVF